jgi:hypothetical protein
MLQVRIAGLSVDSTTDQPVLLLVPADEGREAGVSRRALPIWIGQAEATAILLAIQGIEPPRPMTHDLMKKALEAAELFVSRVEITRLEGGTFYAALILRGEKGEVVLDARPSDSIALAVRFDCPVFIAEDVFDAAAVEVTEVDEDEEVERFRDFLDHVDPADFMS